MEDIYVRNREGFTTDFLFIDDMICDQENINDSK